MFSRIRCVRRLRRKALLVAFGLSVSVGGTAVADGTLAGVPPATKSRKKGLFGRHHQKMDASGTLGYGPPGVHPGFQGFGLGYHLGYGYGGDALGVGAFGGYPFYGGPGYPHPWPQLRRIGGINPFPHMAGPGFPTPDHPNFYGGVGPLVADTPVVTVGDETTYATGFGAATGALPYTEEFLAPFTTKAAADGSRSGVSGMNEGYGTPLSLNSPATAAVTNAAGSIPSLGIEVEPTTDVSGTRAIRITRVLADSVAEKSGLRLGDLLLDVNGYRMETPGNLTWVMQKVGEERILYMRVRGASDGKEHSAKVQLPLP